MRKVKDAVDLTTKEKIYFKGHAKTTYLSDGRNVEDALGEIPSAESSVFKAVYGTTTYEEIVAANNDGKIVMCLHNDIVFRLSMITAASVFLTATYQEYLYQLSCASSGGWWFKRINTLHELKDLDNGNVEVNISGDKREVATPQYVENLLGVIINGDY